MTDGEPLVGDVERERRRSVDRAVDFVLDQLHLRLDLATVAAQAGYSAWHFQRIFTEAMGESPTAFVARARVERAVAVARAEPDRPWQDIARGVGFSTPAQLSRAFRQRYGRNARSWNRSEPLADRAQQPRHGAGPAETTGVNVRVEGLQHFRFAYLRVQDPYTAGILADAWDEVDAWRSDLAPNSPMVGMSWDDPATVPLELCRYDLGIIVDTATSLPGTASERWMPSMTAAMVTVDGTIDAVDAAWEYLHRSWLPSSPLRRSALPSIERFQSDPRPTWSRWHLDCILPVGPGR